MLRFVRRRYRMIRDPSDFTQVAITGTHPEAIRMREKLERQEERRKRWLRRFRLIRPPEQPNDEAAGF